MKWVVNTSVYEEKSFVCAAIKGLHFVDEESEDGEVISKPVDGWWVLIRTDLELSDEMAVFVVWNSDGEEPYPDEPEIPKIAFA